MKSSDQKYLKQYRLWIIVGVIGLGLIFSSEQALSQGLDRDRVKAEIEKTDQIIDQARSAVGDARIERPLTLLEQAEQAQEHAKSFLENGRLLLALQSTQRARQAAQRCIGLLVRSDEDRSLVEQQLERTDELVEQVKSMSEGLESTALDMRMQEIYRLQDRARDLLSDGYLRQSLQFTRRAQEICLNILEKMRGSARLKENLRNSLDRANGLIEDNRETVSNCGNRHAVELFDAGVSQVEKAEQLHELGNFEESARILAAGAAHVRQAIRMCRGDSSVEDSERAIETAQTQIEQLRERAQELRNRDADKLLDEATEKLDQARKYHDEGEYERALVVVRVVIELNQQAAKILGAW